MEGVKEGMDKVADGMARVEKKRSEAESGVANRKQNYA